MSWNWDQTLDIYIYIYRGGGEGGGGSEMDGKVDIQPKGQEVRREIDRSLHRRDIYIN